MIVYLVGGGAVRPEHTLRLPKDSA